MAPPPVAIYVTSLTSSTRVRSQTELLRRSLRGYEIPFTEHDCFADEEAKVRWQRAKPPGQALGFPGFTVGGEWIGTMDEFEEHNEAGTIPQFLRQDTDMAGNASIGEADLEKLMREMTEEDLDKLVQDVGGGAGGDGDGAGAGGSGGGGLVKGVGLMNPEGAESLESARQADGVMEIGGSGPLPSANILSGGSDALGGILHNAKESASVAAQQTADTITQKANEVISSLGGGGNSAPKSDGDGGGSQLGTKISGDDIDQSSPFLKSSTTTPATTATQQQQQQVSPIDNAANRRMSKEDIAAEMRSADTVDGLLESLGRASEEGQRREALGKEKKD